MDTIIIKIYGPNKFEFRNKSLFLPEITYRSYEALTPTEKKTQNSSRPYLRKFILHSNIKDEYIPSVEVFEKLSKDVNKTLYMMKITFSVPKLLYWNSIQEVINVDKSIVIRKLKYSLERAGVVIKDEAIENAGVEAIHFCKNILLPKEIRMRSILDELAKIDITKASDLTERRIKNSSQVLTLYSGVIEHTFYDKIEDIKKPKNKRSDKSNIVYEKTLLKEYKLENREIFRYEYRIKKTQTVKSKLNKLLGRDNKSIIIFKDLFIQDLSKNVLLNNWNYLVQKPENQLTLFEETNKTKLLFHIFEQVKKNNKSAHGMNKAFTSYGIATTIKDFGVKETKKIVAIFWNTSHPERFTQKMKMVSDLIKEMPYKANIAFVTEELNKHEVIDLTYLKNRV